MSQITNFAPAPGTTPDYTSMVIDGYNYGNGICKEFRPDFLAVLNTGDQAKISVDCGRLTLKTTCGDYAFILDDVVRRQTGSHVTIACCADAKKHKVVLKCKAVGNCDANLLRIGLKKFDQCDTAPTFVTATKDFVCNDELNCTQKIVAFVAAANAIQNFATYTIGSDPETVYVEWNVAGIRFDVESWDGFYPPEVVTIGTPAVGKGKDLRRIFSDLDCLPGLCDNDKCYKTYAFLIKSYINSGDGLFSSTTGINNNNSLKLVYKLVWIVVESSATLVHTALVNAFNGGAYNLVCSTECLEDANTKTLCISREDDGDQTALDAMIDDYDDAVSITLKYTQDGVSYYDVKVKEVDLPLSAISGDTISDTPCGPDEIEQEI